MKVVRPRDLAQALDALAVATADTRVLAGGTDLMVEFEAGRTLPDRVIDIWKLSELRGIEPHADGIRIGALTTCSELERSPLVQRELDILAACAATVGAAQIKNRATIGGNLGTASPAADINPVLFALGARVRLVSHAGTRELRASQFITGYRATARRPDELIESIWIARRAADERRAFRKIGTRRAQSIAKVVLALCVRTRAGVVTSVEAAAGSVADRTRTLPALTLLVGNKPDASLIERAARAAALEDCSPRTDVRSTEVYRRAVVQRVLARCLSEILA